MLVAAQLGDVLSTSVLSELMPDALKEDSSSLIAVVVTLSVVAMISFQVLIR